MKNLQVKVLALLLTLIGGSLMYAKVTQLGIPLLPNQKTSIWLVEAKVEYKATGGSSIVSLDVPDDLGGYVNLDEFFVARGFGLNIEKSGDDRRAEWSIRRAKGPQRLYYRVDVAPLEDAGSGSAIGRKSSADSEPPGLPAVPEYSEIFSAAAADMMDQVRDESADIFTFVSQLISLLNNPDADANAQVLRQGLDVGSEQWVERISYLLAGVRIPARMVRGIVLEDGMSNAALTPWLEVHNGNYWEGFDPITGNRGYPPNFVRWSTGSESLVTLQGGRNATLSFSVEQQSRAVIDIAREVASFTHSPLLSWSLFDLPISTQNLYRILLTIPIGAIVIVVMRTLVGFPTFGTFMPILVALAFRETELLWGIFLFSMVVAFGLTLRFYLDRLQLLLVPRLSAVLLMVILLMLIISLLSAKLDLVRGFSIALFPIVIMAMVIERMSITWSEMGPAEALKLGVGSLVVAAMSYLLMTNESMSYIVFVFPEVLLIVLALFLILGRYTGYRLNEIFRFRDLANEAGDNVQNNTKT